MKSLFFLEDAVRRDARRYSFQRSHSGRTLGTISLLLIIVFLSHPLGILGQRAIQNPSVENPTFTPVNSFHRIAEGTLIGWLTTHPLNECSIGPASCRPIERWGTGFNSVSAASGWEMLLWN